MSLPVEKKHSFKQFLTSSFENRPLCDLKHVLQKLSGEGLYYEKFCNIQTKPINEIAKMLKDLSFVSNKSFIIYLIRSEPNAERYKYSVNLHSDGKYVIYIEMNSMGNKMILNSILELQNVTLVNSVNHQLCRFDPENWQLMAKNVPFKVRKNFGYIEIMAKTEDFLDYVTHLKIENLPEKLMISVPLICLNCYKKFKTDCYCRDLLAIRWHVINGFNTIIRMIQLRCIAMGISLNVDLTKKKHLDEFSIDGKQVTFQFWRFSSWDKNYKKMFLRWLLLKKFAFCRHPATICFVTKYYNFDTYFRSKMLGIMEKNGVVGYF